MAETITIGTLRATCGGRISVHDSEGDRRGRTRVAGRSPSASADVRCAERSSQAGSAGNGIRRRFDVSVLRLPTNVDPRDRVREIRRLSSPFVRAWRDARSRPPEPINDGSGDDGQGTGRFDSGVSVDVDRAVFSRAVTAAAGGSRAHHQRATRKCAAPIRPARISAHGGRRSVPSQGADDVVPTRTAGERRTPLKVLRVSAGDGRAK
jgi:hypothetical protein